ncbi:MAG: diguanylate cyclase [Oscillospiraceae bacterium]
MKTMLVVDDMEINRAIFREMFFREFEILEADGGIQALEMLKKEGIDIVLLDIVMPKMNGINFLKEIAKDKNYSNLPIIAVTAEAKYQLEALQNGAWDFIAKPEREEIIKARVFNVLSRKELTIEKERTETLARLQFETEAFQYKLLNSLRKYGVAAWEYDVSKKCIIQNMNSQATHGFDTIVPNVPASLIKSKYVHPDSVDDFKELYREVIQAKPEATRDILVQNADRTGYWWERITYIPLFDIEGKHTKSIGTSIDVTYVHEQETRLEMAKKCASVDSLTNVLNRASFEEKVSFNLQNIDECAAFVLLDFDNFKFINDTYGHIAGDCVLKELAFRMKKALRSTDFVGRIGGDEFALFITGIIDETFLSEKLDAIIKSMASPIDIDSAVLQQTVSMGAALKRGKGNVSFGELYSRADTALYTAKRKGKNRWYM